MQSFYLDNHISLNSSANTFSAERTASYWTTAPSVTFTCAVDPYGARAPCASGFKVLLDGHLARKGNKSRLDHNGTTPQDEMDIADFCSFIVNTAVYSRILSETCSLASRCYCLIRRLCRQIYYRLFITSARRVVIGWRFSSSKGQSGGKRPGSWH